MKKFTLFALLWLAFFAASAQKKKDNTIIIQTTDAPEVAYKRLAALLQDKGYSLESTDKELLSLTTAPKTLNRYAAIKINAYIRTGEKTALYLKGNDGTPGSNAAFTRTFYGGMKGSPGLVSWEELQKVAQNYPGGQVSYTKD